MAPLLGKDALVGTNQVLKALQAGKLGCVVLAEDAEQFLVNRLRAACEAQGVPVQTVPTMKELGRACKIEVGAACAGIRR